MKYIYRIHVLCYDYDSPIVCSDYTIGMFTDREYAYELADRYANNKDELKDGLSSILCKYEVDKFDDFEIHFEEMRVNTAFGKDRADNDVMSDDDIRQLADQEELDYEDFGFGEEDE